MTQKEVVLPSWSISQMIWSRKPDPTNPSADRFQYHTQEGKGLVVLGRLPCECNKVTWKMLDEAIIGASVGNKFRQDGLPIQWFHTLRLAQSHVTVANQILYTAIAT